MAVARITSVSRLAPRLITRATVTPLIVAVRNHFNKDYKPGPFPVTPEQRKAAAKKYDLPEEWYEVYPDDGLGYGDYPNMKPISADARDDFYPWDYPGQKRNFDEIVHVDEEIINDTRYNVNMRHVIPLWEQALWLFSTIVIFTGLFIYFEDYDRKFTQPILAKQMPFKGEVHYTFEPEK